MKICQRKPIYRKVTSYFILGYQLVTKTGNPGSGELHHSVRHAAIDKPFIDYGLARKQIEEKYPETGSVVFVSEKQISKEYYKVSK